MADRLGALAFADFGHSEATQAKRHYRAIAKRLTKQAIRDVFA
jgi:hypothetical protein